MRAGSIVARSAPNQPPSEEPSHRDLVELERVEEVEVEEREVVDGVDPLVLVAEAVARVVGADHVVVARELIQHRLPEAGVAGAVQVEEGRALAAAQDADARAADVEVALGHSRSSLK